MRPAAEAGGLAGVNPECPAHTGGMPVRLHHIVVDAHDLPGLARFWTQALGWKVLSEREREIVIGTDEKGIGQTSAESWTVLADPEGNEFCVIRPKETLIR